MWCIPGVNINTKDIQSHRQINLCNTHTDTWPLESEQSCTRNLTNTWSHFLHFIIKSVITWLCRPPRLQTNGSSSNTRFCGNTIKITRFVDLSNFSVSQTKHIQKLNLICILRKNFYCQCTCYPLLIKYNCSGSYSSNCQPNATWDSEMVVWWKCWAVSYRLTLE